MWNLIAAVDGYPKKIGIGEAAVDAVLGFVVVFLGIAFLVGVIWLVGFIMQRLKTAKPKKANTIQQAESGVKADSSEELDAETVAVITAAIMAYYEAESPKCEFKVKRIKRI